MKQPADEVQEGMTDEEFLAEARSKYDYDPLTGLLCHRRSWGRLPAGRPVTTINNGYLVTRLGRRSLVFASQIAWALHHGHVPSFPLVFKNGDGTDIRISNLIPCDDPSRQSATEKLSANNVSGYKGVSWFSRDNCWRARIAADGRTKHLGYFKNPRRAAAAYRLEAARLHGQFSRIGRQSKEVPA